MATSGFGWGSQAVSNVFDLVLDLVALQLVSRIGAAYERNYVRQAKSPLEPVSAGLGPNAGLNPMA